MKFSNFKTVIIFCPPGVSKGGGESLHSLRNHLFNQGIDVSVEYLVSKSFKQKIKDFDIENYLLIFPEIYICEGTQFKKAKVAIWWLSVDNFTMAKHASGLRDKFIYSKYVLKMQRPLLVKQTLRRFIHLAESYYAIYYLNKMNIEAIYLPRLLGEIFYSDCDPVNKQNIITCSRRKGGNHINQIVRIFKDFKFVFIDNLSESQAHTVLKSSKIYLDLGHFPGSERLPREAVLLRNFIIVNNVGAARNYKDFPLPSEFKVNVKGREFHSELHKLITSIFDNELNYELMYEFRNDVLRTKENYHKIVGELI